MSTTDAAISTLANTAMVDEIDEEFRTAIEEDDAADEAPKKLSRAEKKAAKEAEEKAAREAERAALQALVPWKLTTPTQYGNWEQKREIDQWADDWGQYPRRYRSYSREEWTQAINVLADAVSALADTHPDYQRTTGLYVEEHGSDLLLIRCKEWQLLIQVPTKASASGKKLELKAAPGKDSWGGDDKRADAFAELLTAYVPAGERDTLLDICCQYLRSVRIRVNRATWAAQHPDLAHLLKDAG